jgi:hypothetical protein
MTSDWPFEDPPNMAVITTVKVLEGYPVLLVTHDEDDGGWQFLCGTTNDSDDGRVVGLREMVRKDVSLKELADLPLGWRAWRSSTADPWRREPPSGPSS